MKLLLTLLVFGPLLAAAVAGLFGRRIGDKPSMAITTGFLFLSCALSWYTFSKVAWGGLEPQTFTLAPFINVGEFQSFWSIRLDTLSAVMLIVVTTVSALVHLYSWGYMADDPSKPRFFAYLSLFTFAMLMLVTAADFMQLFFGWEGVGLASYLLIGFWFHKPTANAAAIKAFVVNRVGDFGFALGIMTVFWMFHTIRFAELFPLIAGKAGTNWVFAGQTWSALDLAGVLLFIGAMGKSAQFFLHTWLPDAMEGPTPVSALIHAATMVTAGVYMVCLLSPLYEYAPVAKGVITVIGAVTALFAATVGLAQNDIKRVIAYSTCSQLGYMFFAAGVGAYQAAMFHLFTHAFFKALLFLGAGSVIHGMHHEQDMRKMGGIAKYMKVTYAVMTIGTIAITGLGIPGVEIGFAGFYSKDTIIHAAWQAGQTSPVGYFAFIIGILVAGLTAFYSWRLAFFTFNGHARWGHDGHAHADDHGHAHDDHASHAQIETHSEPLPDHDEAHGHGHGHTPHESPLVMLIPLLVLAVGAIFAGFFFHEMFVGEGRAEFWKGAIFTAPANHVLGEHEMPEWVMLAPLVASVLGLAVAAYVYLLKEGLGAKLAARGGPAYTFFYNKWFFDELYEATFVRGAKALGDLFWKGGDVKIIDGLGPNGVAWVAALTGKQVGKVQTGYVYHYAFVMLLGVAGLLTYALMAWAH
ncbi:MAG TPA: NADH-quinone oxidoreductase subunit L [Caulobacteraceae bacterium]|nr:NADH-quinone oxidoreductase subunit L [Caulobacteraceae bacterium]